MSSKFNRRRLLAATTTTIAAAAILTSKRTAAQGVIGEGNFRYQCEHMWPQLPDKYDWQITHNVAIDPDQNLYVIHEGDAARPDHPSIFVFDSDGKFLRAFGEQFQGGGHGLEIHVEGGTPYLYVAAYQQVKTITKCSLTGEVVWQTFAPVQCGHYAKDEASNPRQIWGRDRFMPTNFAFLPNGEFLLADGYGAYYIHRYDSDGNWLACFGGPGDGRGTFKTPHGLGVDQRSTGDAEIVVTDRGNNTLQTFTLDGKYKKTVGGFGLPANIDTHRDLMLVPELVARLSILDENHNTLATIGDDRERILADKNKSIRSDETRWQQGKFVHPHDACFDQEGNIFVAEWVTSGRVTKLTRV
jgi:hypothetical protein